MVNNMKNNKTTAFRRRVYLVTGAVTAVALVAMIGVYQNIDNGEQGQYDSTKTQEQQVADGAIDYGPGSGVEYDSYEYDEWAAVAEGEEDLNESQATIAQKETLDRNETLDQNDTPDGSASTTNTEENTDETDKTDKTAETAGQDSLSFGSSSTISWPVKGNVLMNYSMDQTTYFATLDQYKYNPAIVIAAKVNDKVTAGVKGVISDVQTNENTGLTVTVDLGSGYQATYGQLKEVKKQKGDTLQAQDVLGYIAEPTKYYSIEGSNLYFAMTKDGKPVNPMSFLK